LQQRRLLIETRRSDPLLWL